MYKLLGIQKNAFPRVALLIGAVIWGLLWYPYRLLEHVDINGPTAAAITYLIALLLGLILFKRSLRVSHLFDDKPYLLFWIGLLVGCASMAYILGVTHGVVMRVLLLFYLAPLWTIIFARLLLQEKLSLHGYWVISLSLTGVATMLWQPSSNFPIPSSYSDWMGLAGGITFALSNVLIRKDQGHSIQLKSLAVWLGVVLVGLSYSLFMPMSHALTDISLDSWLLLLGTGLIVFVLSLFVQYGLTQVPANQAIVILLFELVVAAVAVYLLTDETMTLREWIGGAMIVSASLFSSRMNQE
ncbi:MAG: DMT family transporter [Nitrosomonadales bacterium]|nr:MAG: DMT family transporter [Nitrosomonadales bacterium]